MLKTVIVDDNPNEREALVRLLELAENTLELVGQAPGVKKGVELVQKVKPDLIFLDVEMPDGSGFDLLKQFKPGDFQVIFTTAHEHYAIRALRISALDYLQKPIDLDELRTAVTKASGMAASQVAGSWESWVHNAGKPIPEKIGIPTLNGVQFLELKSIEYIEADGAYSQVAMVDGKSILASRLLKDFVGLLEDLGFLRVHHSYLVHLRHITAFSKKQFGTLTLQSGKVINVSRSKKDLVAQVISKQIL